MHCIRKRIESQQNCRLKTTFGRGHIWWSKLYQTTIIYFENPKQTSHKSYIKSGSDLLRVPSNCLISQHPPKNFQQDNEVAIQRDDLYALDWQELYQEDPTHPENRQSSNLNWYRQPQQQTMTLPTPTLRAPTQGTNMMTLATTRKPRRMTQP